MFKRMDAIIVFPLALLLAVLCWPEAAAPQDATQGKFSGEYFFYGGTLDDRAPPTSKDTKLNIQISGPIAAQMFRRMRGSPLKDSCSGDTDEWKVRDELVCIRDRTTGKVDCYFGFDMRSGKSIGGVIC